MSSAGSLTQVNIDLGELIEAIYQAESTDALYRCMAEFVPKILPADHVSMSFYLVEEHQLQLKALFGTDESCLLLKVGQKSKINKSYLEYQKLVASPAVWCPVDGSVTESYHSNVVQALVDIGVVSMITAPVRVGREVVGTLNVSSRMYQYQEAEMLLMQQVATLVGSSLDRFNNHQNAVANARRLSLHANSLKMINALSESMSQVSSMDVALEEVATFAKKVIGTGMASYCELQPCGKRIRVLGSGGSLTNGPGEVMSLKRSGLSEVLTQGRQLYIDNHPDSRSPSVQIPGYKGLNHFWSFPIVISGAVRGAFNIGSEHLTLHIEDVNSVFLALSRLLGSTLQRIDDHIEILNVMEEIEHQNKTDMLTGLPNRSEFHRCLDECLAEVSAKNQLCGILFFDLDEFKNINDTLGHAIGDQLLCVVSRRVEQLLKSRGIVARIGGDEFLILLPNITSADVTEVIGREIIEAVGESVIIAGRELQIGVSVGAVSYPVDGVTSEELITNADIAMYRAKESGRNICKVFNDELSQSVNRRVKLEAMLRSSILNDELSLVFQPQYNCSTGEIESIEALIRWHHPVDGLIPPDVFIPIAEKCGFINKITDWVLNNSLRVVTKLRRHYPGLRVSVNVSASEFSAIGNLYNRVMTAIEKSGLPSNALELELPESALLAHPDHAEELIGKFNKAGIVMALDDFGTGYASLSYLIQLPIDAIKIDRSFVDGIECDHRKQAVVKGIISIASSLSLSCIGEGVETDEQFNWLAENGCQLLQGYLICRPVSQDQLLLSFKRLNIISEASWVS